jgi:hypothetical protein
MATGNNNGNRTEDIMSASATVIDIRAKFTGKATDKVVKKEVSLDGLLAEVEALNSTGHVKVDVPALRREVEEAKADPEKRTAIVDRLAYYLRIGRTFKAYGTTADDWRPLRRTSGGYVILGGPWADPEEYTRLLVNGFGHVLGPDAAGKGDEGIGTCHLCGHRPVRYFFPLVCDAKSLIVLSGCECIHQYVNAVIPDETEAGKVIDAMKRTEYTTRAATTANNKLDALLDSPSGWGMTFGEAIEIELPEVSMGYVVTARKVIEDIRTGAVYTKTKVDRGLEKIRAIGFDATWRRVSMRLASEARKAAKTSTPASTSAFETLDESARRIVKTPERFEILKAKGLADTDKGGYWHRSFRAVTERWTLSPRWAASIEIALDKEEAKVSPAPAPAPAPAAIPREGDTFEIVGTVSAVEHVGHDRARYEHDKVKVDCLDVVVIFKDYSSRSSFKVGSRVKVSGKAGWIMDRRSEGRKVYIVINGRKKTEIV